MARITGQQGATLTNQLAQYLDQAQGEISSEQLQRIVNSFLQGGDQLTTVSGVTTTGIYKRFNEFDKVEGKVEVVTTGLWSGGNGSLTSFYTSSVQVNSSSGFYYWNVYNKDPQGPDSGSAEVQFAVSFGDANSTGSVPLSENDDALYPTRATYFQYRSLLLDPTDSRFTFDSSDGTGFDSDDIYVINVSRARYREKIDPGNISITLSDGTNTITLIDDSGKKFSDEVGRSGRVFNMVIGDLNLGTQDEATIDERYDGEGRGFGLFYPDHGIIILNPSALENSAIPNTTWTGLSSPLEYDDAGDPTESVQNQSIIYDSIVTGGDIEARRTENVSTSHYFVRANNREFNFSNNPSYSNSEGEFVEPSFEQDPRVYITTVGLFDDANEMLAVAKSSEAITKSFDKEVLIKVKLSF